MADIEKKSFIIYENWARLFTELDSQDAGDLIKAICNYKLGKESHIENTTINAIFGMIQTSLDIDNERYIKKVERIQKVNESRRNRNEIVNEKETKSQRNRDEIVGVNVNDNVNVNVNDNVNVNVNVNDAFGNQAEEVMSLYNTTCLFMEPATMITPKRLSLITELLNGYGLDEIKEVFQKANSSDYLLGKNSKGWKASFDWIIDINNFVKIAEGNFDNKVEKTSKMMNHNYDFEALEKDSKMAASKRAKEIDLKVLPKEEKPKDEKPVYKGDYEQWILECEEWERRKNDI